MPSLPPVLAGVVCALVRAASLAAEPPDTVGELVACMAGENYAVSSACTDDLTALATGDPSVRADARVHRAFAAYLYREIANFREWQRWFATRSLEDLENESPEYEDGNTAMLLADTIRFQLLPHADPESERVLFDALLAASVMNEDMERGIARYGQRAMPATLDLARSGQPDRRETAYTVLGWMLEVPAADMLALPLASSGRDAAMRVITDGLQEGEPSVRLAALRAAQRGGVRSALPMLRVLASTLPADDPYRLRQAAAVAVASLSR